MAGMFKIGSGEEWESNCTPFFLALFLNVLGLRLRGSLIYAWLGVIVCLYAESGSGERETL